MALRSLRRDRLTLICTGFVLLIGLLAVLAARRLQPRWALTRRRPTPSIAFSPPYLWPYIRWLIGTDPITAPTLLYQTGGVPHWLGHRPTGP